MNIVGKKIQGLQIQGFKNRSIQSFHWLLCLGIFAFLTACGGGGTTVTPPDTTPNAFTFTDQTDVALSTVIESNSISIAGITAATSITISGGEYSIAGGTFTSSAGTVMNGQSVIVRQTSSANNSTTTDATLTVGGVSDVFSVTTLDDLTPDAFTFVDQTGVALGTLIESAAITVAGISAETAISVTGGEYSIDSGAFTSEDGMVANGQSVVVRQTSSANNSTTTDATLTIGGVSDVFSVTTLDDTIPDAFSFVDQTGIALNTQVESSAISVAGINAASNISVAGGEYSIDGEAFTSQDGMVLNGQSVIVRQISSSAHATTTDVTLNIGGVSDVFSVTTIETLSLTNFQAADVVIGQAGFAVDPSDNGDRNPAANTLLEQFGNPVIANGRLYLSDSENHRLLGFNSIPTANNASADIVLGQPDFTTNTSGTSDVIFNFPESVSVDNNKMFLADPGNNRILIWNSVPTSSGTPADVVLGQADFSSSAAGACNSTGLEVAEAVFAIDGKLIVADRDHNRVLIWNTIPTSNNAPADIVLGQQDFTHCAANDTDNDGVTDGPSAQTLSDPAGIWSDGTRLVIVDKRNNRVLIWSTFPSTNFAAADVVIGQSDFTHNTRNDDNQDNVVDANPSARTLFSPVLGIYSNGTQLFIADTSNNRVLVWNNFPSTNFAAADVVIGQGDFTHNERNDDDQDGNEDSMSSARTLIQPGGIYQVENQLIISDGGNSRVLIFNNQ
ncbi:hypothetical protein [Aliikangiella coralliicola]|uniref:NHL repeat containing protein n=1 Tax=Aliikangiella coralliicola TaxID=2592383 RepID=A0A545U8V5_9GAMM|nr:hypothetical protein [Aliikangiella coralliicola]TQV85888.1 hypothetical protein FLL46_18365 [Aliikangiella coralliicola]